MGGVQRLAFNANQCEGVWPRMQRVICTPAPPYPYGNQSVGSPYGRRSAPGIPRHGGCTKNLYSSPRIGGCTVPLASGSSAPLPSSRGPRRPAGWIIAEGALALHAGHPHPNSPVGGPHGRRSAPGIPRQTNAGRAHPAPTLIAHRPPASQQSSWGPSWAALCAWYSTPNRCGEGTPGAHPISLSPHPCGNQSVGCPYGRRSAPGIPCQPMWGGMAPSALSRPAHCPPPYPCGNQPAGGP
jgi:hypothetical protein